LAGLGNYVWTDSDKDGLQSPLEQGIAGISVSLSFGGQIISTTHTNLTGLYSFTNLLLGEYTVCFTLPMGFTFTVPGTDPNSDQDSNADPNTGCATPVTLTAGEFNPTIDAGVHAAPTAITLARFEVSHITQAGQRAVRVDWQTGLEADTFGFHILRGESGNINTATQINDSLIAATGRGSGSTYMWVDETADDTAARYYWLREVELDGTLIDYGPVTFASSSANEQVAVAATATPTALAQAPAPAIANGSVQGGGVTLPAQASNSTSASAASAPAIASAPSTRNASEPASIAVVLATVPANAPSAQAVRSVPTTAAPSPAIASVAHNETASTSKFAANSEREKSSDSLEITAAPTVQSAPVVARSIVATSQPQRSSVNVALGNNRQLVQSNARLSTSSSSSEPSATPPAFGMLWVTGAGLSAIGVVFMALALMRRRTR